MIDAEYERELTLTKGLKTELNKSLDHLLVEQGTYWTLWREETDDVAEIYGSVGINHEAVAEVYRCLSTSPPAPTFVTLKPDSKFEISSGDDDHAC